MSDDATVAIARAEGAEVVEFSWNGQYPKKKQWGMEHPAVRHDWVLHLDADEIVTDTLAAEITAAVGGAQSDLAAFEVTLEYHFAGKPLRYGHKVRKRSLVRRSACVFPEVGDLEAPGITEVEGHYQPLAQGRVERLRSPLIHDDPDPLGTWIGRHNRYSDWEAHLLFQRSSDSVNQYRSKQGRTFAKIPFKPLAFFLYSFFFRAGFLDGRSGFDYAVALSWYYWLTGAKLRELRRVQQESSPPPSPR